MSEPAQARSKRLYRDSLVLNFVLATVILVVSWATGGNPVKALVVAVFYLVVATAWTWWRIRQRVSKERP
jgi:membrane protein implicated in regulation of membrane protease activity